MKEGGIGNEEGREKQPGRQRCMKNYDIIAREDRHGKLRSTYGKRTQGGLCIDWVSKRQSSLYAK
jgi:hypothetical protein